MFGVHEIGLTGVVIYEAYTMTSTVRPKPCPDGSMQFNMTTYPKYALEVMNSLRRSGALCDVRLIVASETYFVHRIVLAAASPYFRAMFDSGLKECQMNDIPLQGIKSSVLAMLIDFAYTSEISISELNVCALLPAASMFQMNSIVEACCTFLEGQLDPDNCIGIADFAQAHGCQDLYDKARSYIYDKFSFVTLHEEFLQLSSSQLIQVIRRDEINVRCESDVFQAVISWVRFDLTRRLYKLEQLLSSVRCHFLTPVFLQQQLEHCDILKQVPMCHDYLKRVYSNIQSHVKCRDVRRKPNAPFVIFVTGGYLRQSLPIVECFNPENKKWSKLSDLIRPRSGIAACVVHGLLYVVGGRDNTHQNNEGLGDSALQDCDVYDPHTNVWRPCAPMRTARNRLAIGVLDAELYAVGGSNENLYYNTMEKYDPDRDVWSEMCSMVVARMGLGVIVVNRFLFAVGGYNGADRLNCMERYHPEFQSWKFMAPMNSCRSGLGVAAVDEFIYALGGYDDQVQLNTVERYLISQDLWEVLQPMHFPRSAFGVTAFEGKIYVVGGYDGQEFLQSVEVYNPDTDCWNEVTRLSSSRSGLALAIGTEPCLR